jgi:F0F1-type ATP synthase delta subunit
VKVDPAILGGLQIQVGEKFLDLSVASRISNLSASLDGAVEM